MCRYVCVCVGARMRVYMWRGVCAHACAVCACVEVFVCACVCVCVDACSCGHQAQDCLEERESYRMLSVISLDTIRFNWAIVSQTNNNLASV